MRVLPGLCYARCASRNPATGLRARALFAIGFLQDRHPIVHRVLLPACERSWELLKENAEHPTRNLVSEAHAALFAVGDCYGAVDAKDDATFIRTHLKELVNEVVDTCTSKKLAPVARAACYMIAFTGTRGDGSSEDLLTRLGTNDDEVTRELSAWALEERSAAETDETPL